MREGESKDEAASVRLFVLGAASFQAWAFARRRGRARLNFGRLDSEVSPIEFSGPDSEVSVQSRPPWRCSPLAPTLSR